VLKLEATLYRHTIKENLGNVRNEMRDKASFCQKSSLSLLLILSLFLEMGASAAKQKLPLPTVELQNVPSRSKAEKALPKQQLSAFPPLDLSKCPRDASGQRIVAIVEGTTITEKRLMAELKFAQANQKFTQMPVPRTKDEELGLLGALSAPAFDQLVARILLDKYAREHGIVVSDEEIQASIEKTNAKLPPGQKVQDLLISCGWTLEDIKQFARTQLIGMKIEESMADKVPTPTEEELARFRKQRPVAGGGEPEIRLSEIFLSASTGTSTQGLAMAERMAKNIRQMLLEGADFCDLALRYSHDIKTSRRCGDHGYVTKGKLPPEIAEVAFKLKVGEVSDVIRTSRGFHILMVREKYPTALRSAYTRFKQRELYLRWYQDLRNKARIEKFF